MKAPEKKKVPKPDPATFFCPYEDCPDYAKVGQGNVTLHAPYGEQGSYLLACKSCRRTFSENRGTIFFRLKTPKEKVLKALQCLAEGNSVSSTARIMGTKRDTIRKWLKKAARHVEAVNDYLIRNLKLTRVQLDEMWSYVKKKAKRCGPETPKEYGDAWTWKAMDPDSKLRIAPDLIRGGQEDPARGRSVDTGDQGEA